VKRIVVGISGASGVIYGKKLVEELSKRSYEIYLLVTDPALSIGKKELSIDLIDYLSELSGVTCYDYKNLDAPIASGSFQTLGMVIVPCSMKSLACIAQGISDNLLYRVADVCLKERRRFILVPRETPLSEIHLENMLKLRRMGVDILPAMPGFYNCPRTIDDLVDFIVQKIFLLLE